MRKINLFLGILAMMAILFTGCTKEENTPLPNDDAETAFVELSFGPLLNDLGNRNNVSSITRTHFSDIPTCSSEDPAYVVLEIEYPGQAPATQGPITIDILSDGTEYFTAYSDLLKVPVANNSQVQVTLTSFKVYSDTDELIWIAPKESSEGEFDGYVDQALPFSFMVQDGTKPYIDVEVLCYDRRMVNEYGYVFFDLDQKEIFNFCLFGNYCPPSGRHYVAKYSVDVWIWENDAKGVQIYDSETNMVNEDGLNKAEPLCLALPDDPSSEDDAYYFEITLLGTDEYDGGDDVGRIVRSGILTEFEAKTLFVGEDKLEYYHFQVGCNDQDNPPVFNDPDSEVQTYYACLRELNDSNVAAVAYVTLDGNEIRTQIAGFGFDNGIHPQHIHGKADDSFDSSCPDMSADLIANGGNGNGLLEVNEGLSAYGAPQLFLTTSGAGDGSVSNWPNTNTGMLIYDRTVTLGTTGFPSLADMTPLDKKTIVLHGKKVGMNYIASLPIACGDLEEN